MNVRLLYFAWVREKIGVSEELLAADGVVTVEALVAELRTRSVGHAAALSDLSRLRAAVNQDFVGWEAVVRAGDEVAIFPPVTGG